MKKAFLKVFATVLFLSSCATEEFTDENSFIIENSDIEDSNVARAGLVLPKKVVDIYEIKDKGKIERFGTTSIFTYKGNKLVSCYKVFNEDGVINKSKITYSYTGNYLTQVKVLDASNKLLEQINYTYAKGRLVKSFENQLSPRTTIKTTYTYTKGKVIAKEVFDTEDFDGFAGPLITTEEKIIVKGNVVKYNSSDNDGGTEAITMTYDNKRNPFYNIEGFKMFNQAGEPVLTMPYDINLNNTVKLVSKNSSSGNSTTNFKNTYCPNGYIKQSKGIIKESTRTIDFYY